MLLEGIILNSVAQIENNRTISAIYYLLIGKRSIQTVQDAYMYELDQFFGVFYNLDKRNFDQIITELTDKHCLIDKLDDNYLLSDLGKKCLLDQVDKYPLHYLMPLKYNQNDRIFYNRLLLVIQALANKKMGQSTYIPVIDQTAITDWVVKFYQRLKYNINDSLQCMYDELFQLLSHFSAKEASLFTDRLTGYQIYGMSLHQLSTSYEMKNYNVQLMLTGIIQHMMDLILSNKSDYPFLNLFITDLSHARFLSQSANRTKELLNKGYDLTMISRLRKLRKNTIYDHIVEIALADSYFQITPYVTEAEQYEILKAYNETNSTKLKVLKNNVSEDISYFQIRLVLATSRSK